MGKITTETSQFNAIWYKTKNYSPKHTIEHTKKAVTQVNCTLS